MTVVVRPPTIRDADELARINIASWQHAYAGVVPQLRLDEMSLLTYRQRWIDRLSTAESDRATLVAEVDGFLASYATGGPYRNQDDAEPEDTTGLGELYALYSDPRMHRRDAGTAVHDALLGWLGGRGYEEAALWVLAANDPSRAWYDARGWSRDGATSLWHSHGRALAELRLRHSLP